MIKYEGLKDAEIERNRTIYGSNELEKKESETFLEKFIGNLKGSIMVILLVALLVYVVLSFFKLVEWYEAISIAAAILISTYISTKNEYSSEKSFETLQEEASKTKVKVYRNGSATEILVDEVVFGDLVILESGDLIPADGLILEGSISVNQSTLNGESKEAIKIAIPENYEEDTEKGTYSEYHAFRGTIVVGGEAIMRVTCVGNKTKYGEIASELQEETRMSPLQLQLEKLGLAITKGGYTAGIAIAIAYVFNKIIISNHFDIQKISETCANFGKLGLTIVDAIVLSIIIIVMAAPEGLPMMVAMVLSQNMRKMLKDNVLVKKLLGIEAAGALNILFSDKTGTITKGQLEVVEFIDGNINVSNKYGDIPNKLRKIFNLSISQNTTAKLSDSNTVIGGNATERAAMQYIDHSESINDNINVVKMDSFDSSKKYSATQLSGQYNITLFKGAPEKILDKCINCYDSEGNVVAFNKNKLNEKIDELANRAMRIIAIATTDKPLVNNELADGLTLVGLMAIRDEVRNSSIEAIKEVLQAQVQTVMITGDRKETAIAIAKEAGLITSNDDLVLTSSELNVMSDDEVKNIIKKIRVIARALPTDKSRMVRLGQELDMVVGMTGDGVNDAPALKKADVGFAMGSGTEVAKSAGDIVILDDNFKSIAKAILYGRTIRKSIRKFVIFQLTINVSACLTSAISLLIGLESPLSVIQILWVNLVMDTLAALAFGGEPALKEYMEEVPTKRSESIVSKYMWSQIITGGIYIFGAGMIFLNTSLFKSIFPTEISLATGYFTFFIMCAVFNGFNARTRSINLFKHIGRNKGFLSIMGLIAIVQLAMTFIGGKVLNCTPMNATQWFVVIAIAFLIIPIDLIRKAMCKNI